MLLKPEGLAELVVVGKTGASGLPTYYIST